MPQRDTTAPRFWPLTACLVVVSSVACFASYSESRLPSSWFIVALPLQLLVTPIAALVAVFRSLPSWRHWFSWSAPLAALCLAAPWIGSQLGLAAREELFRTTLRPRYDAVIKRLGMTTDLGKASQVETALGRGVDESEFHVQAWRNAEGQLVAEFTWATTGFPPTHFAFIYCESGTIDAEDQSHWNAVRIDDRWFSGDD